MATINAAKAKKRVVELRESLDYHSYRYHVLDDPVQQLLPTRDVAVQRHRLDDSAGDVVVESSKPNTARFSAIRSGCQGCASR